MKKNLLLMMALAVALVWTGCQPEDLLPPEEHGQLVERADSVFIRIRAYTVGDPVSKGLVIGDGQSEANTTWIRSVWDDNQTVHVYAGNSLIGELSATPEENPVYAVLSGVVYLPDDEGENGTEITLVTPSGLSGMDYTGQVGKLLKTDDAAYSIESKYSFAQAVLLLDKNIVGQLENDSPVVFENMQSIYRISFRFQHDSETSPTPVSVLNATFSARGLATGGGLWLNQTDGTGPILVNLGEATTDPFFVALRYNDTRWPETLDFQVVGSDGFTYLGSKNIPAAAKPHGTFVSMKNTVLSSRLGLSLSPSETVDTVL